MFSSMIRSITMAALVVSVAASSTAMPLTNAPAAFAANCPSCNADGGGAGGAGGAPSLPSLTAGPQTDTVGIGFHMTSSVNLVRSGGAAGQIDVVTNTNTNSWGLGFTGGVFLLFRDQLGAVVYVSQLHTFGVDAKSVFWGTSSRTDYWHELIPGGSLLASQVTSIEIIQQHAPINRVPSILQQIDDDYQLAKTHCQSVLGKLCPLP